MKRRTIIAMICVLAMICGTMFTGCGKSSDNAAEDSANKTEPVKIKCENGVMLGKTQDGVTSFKGVAYAKQPVGDLRWKAPQAPEASDEEVECYKFGHTALQYEWPTEPASYSEKGEDCLTLNIWMPENAAKAEKPLPVMVFFHGGAYGWGGTTDSMYDGQNFIKANQDVILVTANYRLGLMAWADFSKIEGGESYTDVNLGIRDHIAALQWIQKNISGFGGDAKNVTIFGESAGGFSTTALTVSPAAKGLFKRAIAQSGVLNIRDRAEAQKFADFIVNAAGAKNMKDLLAISAEKWLELDSTKWIGDETCGIVADGEIIPEKKDLDAAIAEAAKSGTELLLGTNNDEWNYFKEDQEGETDKDKFDAWVAKMDTVYKGVEESTSSDGKVALSEFMKYEEGLVPEEYTKDEAVKAALTKSAFMTETWRYQHIDFADKYAKAGGTVYMYLWKVPSTRDNMYKSAVHAVELAYVFNNLKEDIYAGEVDKATAEKAQQAWTNYAKTGNPSIQDVEWKKYDADNRETMVIEKDGWKCEPDPSKTAREYMSRIYGDEPLSLW